MLKSTRIQRTITTPALGVLLAGLFSLGSGATASAADAGTMARPTGCHYEVPASWGAVARCDNHNGGTYRAIAVCKYPNGTVHQIEGSWKQSGWSYAYCQGDSKATSAGIETRV
ncbi:hypothetical protein [Streptomyces sp. H-KF8]|uniref:hypothetical protein n=1 Tax=Streptomyces sp. H-KF8 TaxID=1727216 RepID=UPI00099FA5CB|nr:hypothetical protein [Streptomyces sp. H-KF8]